jgi:hypothetical protein
MRAARCALLCAVPVAVTFAGPAVLGYGWGRLAAIVAAVGAFVALAATEPTR